MLPATGTNCGSRLRKKIAILGLAMLLRNPWRSASIGASLGGWAFRSSWLGRPRTAATIDCTPRKIRYAAPMILSAAKGWLGRLYRAGDADARRYRPGQL